VARTLVVACVVLSLAACSRQDKDRAGARPRLFRIDPVYKASERVFARALAVYEWTLHWSLRHRRTVVVAFLMSLALTAALLAIVPKGFIPSADAASTWTG
jgi:multidrug efflux pump subunit AcrB